jgi:putative FmdB family regulatory protein
MPIYEYQCDSCGLRDEKFWKRISAAKDTIKCGSCDEDMRKLVTAGSFTFNHSAGQKRGSLPPSTGTSDDWNFDKAIGRDAEDKWGKIEKRNKVKDTTVRDEYKAGRLVNRDQLVPKQDGTGEYRVITEPERVRTNQNRQTAFDIAKAAKEQGKSPDPKK